ALAGCADEPQPPHTAEISKAAWQNEPNVGIWRFTVDKGVLTCHPSDSVTFTSNGTEYALSDDARWKDRYPSVSPILVKGYVEIHNQPQAVPALYARMTERVGRLYP